jgi:predicted nucleotide-binding protein (sugar kinase/HSP70/actin superfamily)
VKVTCPHAGMAWVAIRALFEKNGVEVIIPPKCSKQTLTLGSKYSPEWMCLPFKVNLGNFIEALDMGADTLVHVEGANLCRLGKYADLMENILRDRGYEFQMMRFNWQEQPIGGMIKVLNELLGDRPLRQTLGDIKFGITQLMACDEVETLVQQVRPREKRQGSANAVWRTAGERLSLCHSPQKLKRVRGELMAELNAIELNPNADPLKVGIVGEFFMTLEPFCNMDIEEELGKLGVEVVRTNTLSGWAKLWLVLGAVGISHGNKVKKAAAPYLSRDVSGDAVQSLGETVLHSQEGFDGIVHIQPFTCMPEIIAQNIMPNVSRDHDIPVLSIVLDEQMGKAGMVTRVEAFADLIQRRRESRHHALASS